MSTEMSKSLREAIQFMGVVCTNLVYLRDSPSHEYRLALFNALFPTMTSAITQLGQVSDTIDSVQTEHFQLKAQCPQLQQMCDTLKTQLDASLDTNRDITVANDHTLQKLSEMILAKENVEAEYIRYREEQQRAIEKRDATVALMELEVSQLQEQNRANLARCNEMETQLLHAGPRDDRLTPPSDTVGSSVSSDVGTSTINYQETAEALKLEVKSLTEALVNAQKELDNYRPRRALRSRTKAGRVAASPDESPDGTSAPPVL